MQIYRILERVTPLKSDCGLLCNKACCDGGDEDLGMYLFPGEEVLLSGIGYFRITPTDIQLDNGSKVLLANCDGKCDRKFRPLACRIFPLTPYVTYRRTLTLEMDIRAIGTCPLAKGNTLSLQPDFIRAVRQGIRIMSQDSDILSFLEMLSRILDEYAQLPDLL
ncbi:MAG: hypothetical protein ACM3YE_17355 [Bacteroidota bacterium]